MCSRETKRSLSSRADASSSFSARARWAMCIYRRRLRLISRRRLQGTIAVHARGDSSVQQVARKEDRAFSRDLLKRRGAGRDCAGRTSASLAQVLRVLDGEGVRESRCQTPTRLCNRGGGERARAKDRQRQQGVLRAYFHDDEASKRAYGGCQAADRSEVVPPPMRTLNEGNRQRSQHRHSEYLARHVDAAAVLAARLRNAAHAKHARQQPNLNREKKNPSPADMIDDDAAHSRSNDPRETIAARPDADGALAELDPDKHRTKSRAMSASRMRRQVRSASGRRSLSHCRERSRRSAIQP